MVVSCSPDRHHQPGRDNRDRGNRTAVYDSATDAFDACEKYRDPAASSRIHVVVIKPGNSHFSAWFPAEGPVRDSG
jgi:hypothetical protein